MLENPEYYGLPAPTWRTYQREQTEAVLENFTRNKYVMLDAPTGSGKSIMAAATACSQGWWADYLVETIYLEQQYRRTIHDARTVTGRRNHACILGEGLLQEGLTADDGPCPCDYAAGEEPCSYYKQWWDCQSAQHVVLNYAYAVRVLRARTIKYGTERGEVLQNPFRNRQLMVCDEGHMLERALLTAAGADIHASTLNRCGLKPPVNPREFTAWQAWANEVAPTVSANVEKYGGVVGLAVQERTRLHGDVVAKSRRWRAVQNFVATIEDMGNDANTICSVTRDGWSLRPIWVWGKATGLLFQYAQQVLIMSATLGAPWLIARLLGLPEDSVETVYVPHTFPLENRLVFFWPVAKMKHGMSDSDKVRQAKALDYIASLGNFSGQKGVVHCNSYELGDFLYANVAAPTRARIMRHTSADREEVFEQFRASKEPRILLSPAATTGIDWPHEIGWQMIPKVPFADLSDELVRARFEYIDDDGTKLGRIVYAHEAACQLIQACGRCTRAADDKGVTIITDENFWTNFRFTAPDAYPEWFRESVRRYDPKRR